MLRSSSSGQDGWGRPHRAAVASPAPGGRRPINTNAELSGERAEGLTYGADAPEPNHFLPPAVQSENREDWLAACNEKVAR